MIPDPEATAVAWAKADPDLTVLLAGRVATRLPKGWASSGPPPASFLRVVLIDGTRDVEAPIGGALIQWDAYAFAGDKPAPDYPTASLLARTLVDKASLFDGPIAGAHVYGFDRITGPRRNEEDADAGWARYTVDMLLTLR